MHVVTILYDFLSVKTSYNWKNMTVLLLCLKYADNLQPPLK